MKSPTLASGALCATEIWAVNCVDWVYVTPAKRVRLETMRRVRSDWAGDLNALGDVIAVPCRDPALAPRALAAYLAGDLATAAALQRLVIGETGESEDAP